MHYFRDNANIYLNGDETSEHFACQLFTVRLFDTLRTRSHTLFVPHASCVSVLCVWFSGIHVIFFVVNVNSPLFFSLHVSQGVYQLSLVRCSLDNDLFSLLVIQSRFNVHSVTCVYK